MTGSVQKLAGGAARAKPIPAMVGICGIAACSTSTYLGPTGPDAYEFANMRESHKYPKTTPTKLVKAFRKYCVDPFGDHKKGVSNALKDDYIRVGTAKDGPAFESHLYFVDNKDPALTFIETTNLKMCTVQAAPRTGQKAEIKRFVAKEYPNATRYSGQSGAIHYEDYWVIQEKPEVFLFTTRSRIVHQDNVLQLGISIRKAE